MILPSQSNLPALPDRAMKRQIPIFNPLGTLLDEDFLQERAELLTKFINEYGECFHALYPSLFAKHIYRYVLTLHTTIAFRRYTLAVQYPKTDHIRLRAPNLIELLGSSSSVLIFFN